jgi:hypothetical protein
MRAESKTVHIVSHTLKTQACLAPRGWAFDIPSPAYGWTLPQSSMQEPVDLDKLLITDYN